MLSLRSIGNRSFAALLAVSEIVTSAIRSIFLVELKAETGDAAAQFNLGMNHYVGQGVAHDYAKAYFWLGLAAAAKIEGAKQENIRKFQKVIDKYRDAAASRLTPADLTRVQEQALEWFQAHPQRLSMKLNDDVTGFAALRPGLRTLVKGVGIVLAIWLIASIGIATYTSLDNAGWITHNYDTPVWIGGDWMVGEYRDCQMRTKTVPAQRKDLDSLDKLPRLFCAQDANGLFDFQREIDVPSHEVQIPPPGAMFLIGVTASELDHYFHTMPVRYNGRIDRQDKWVIWWRCQRNGSSILSSAAITCNAVN